jgi:hypothetical protein
MGLLEKQIEYIRNNLLRRNLTLYLPDVKMLSNQISSIFSSTESRFPGNNLKQDNKKQDISDKNLEALPSNIKERLLSKQEVASRNLMD